MIGTRCITVMGEQSGVDVVSMRVADSERIEIEGIGLDTIYTPGHTSDSYSFHMGDRVFTGDTLLIRGTGRTDFQNGNPVDQYRSIFNRLLKLPDETLIYPAHDYKGDTVSTIGEEKAFNPRLQVSSVQEYVDIMNSLNLPNPKMMDAAVPANLRVGLKQDLPELRERSLSCDDALALLEKGECVLVDLRDKSELAHHGRIPGSVHAPYEVCPTIWRAAGCCTSSPTRRVSGSFLIAPMASAQPWRSRPPTKQGFLLPAISRAGSTPGKKGGDGTGNLASGSPLAKLFDYLEDDPCPVGSPRGGWHGQPRRTSTGRPPTRLHKGSGKNIWSFISVLLLRLYRRGRRCCRPSAPPPHHATDQSCAC